MPSNLQAGSGSPTRSQESLDSHTIADIGADNSTQAPNLSTGSSSSKDYPQHGQQESQHAQSTDRPETDTEKAAPDNWDDDPHNPRNWSGSRKWTSAAVVSIYTLVSPLASSMIAPGLPEIARAFNVTNPTIAALTLSIFVLAYAIGPLFITPFSEVYGRSWPLHISNIFFLIFNLATAWSPNVTSFIVFRFLAGLGGSAPMTIGAGSIADLFAEKDRAVAMSLFSLGPLMGPIIGPIAGGFITQDIGYQWVFRIISIAAGIAGVVGIFVLQETYHPVLRKKYGYPDLSPQGSFSEVLSENLRRPVQLLTRSMICFILSLYMAIIYGLLYLMFVTFPTLFSTYYGWGPGIAGLAYLGLGIGFIVAGVAGPRVIDAVYQKLAQKNGGKGKPEYRIPPMLVGSFLIPVGLLWYGWSAHARLHYMMPIVGSGIFGAGMMFIFIPIQLYLVDAFTYAASAIAAATAIRSLFGFAFPLFGQRLFDAMGTGGGHSFLAGIAVVVGVPFPIWMFFKGEEMRARNPLNR